MDSKVFSTEKMRVEVDNCSAQLRDTTNGSSDQENCSKGNACCPCETPLWQKKITEFYPCLPKTSPENVTSGLSEPVQKCKTRSDSLMKNEEGDAYSNVSSPMDVDNN